VPRSPTPSAAGIQRGAAVRQRFAGGIHSSVRPSRPKGLSSRRSISARHNSKRDTSAKATIFKIKLQLLQFQTDVSSARLAKVQALVGLREFLAYNAVPADYDVIGDLAYQPLKATWKTCRAKALRERPDFRAAELGTTAAQSQILLAKANAKVDVNGTYDFTHVSGENTASLFVNFELPIFNRNQGEIARTGYALTQAQEQQQGGERYGSSDVPMPMRR
jgi:outer membrane protein TolC